MNAAVAVDPLSPPREAPAQRGTMFVLYVCLGAIAVNAVLIQTVIADDSPIKNYLRVAVIAALVSCIVVARIPIMPGIVLLLLNSVVLYATASNPDQLSYVFIFVVVTVLLNVRDDRRVTRLFVITSLLSLGLVFALLAAGITNNVTLELRNRQTFGTAGVPFFFNLVYGAGVMLLVYAFKYRLRSRFVLTLAVLAVSTVLFQATDARGGYLSLVGFIVVLALIPALSRIGLFRFIVAILPILFLVGSFLIASLWTNTAANRLLSYRPMLFHEFFNAIDPADYVLSSTVKAFGISVDSSYIHLLVGGGGLVCLVFIVIFYRAVRALFQDGANAELAFVIATCIYFNTESIMLRVENMFTIYFWYLIFKHSPAVIVQRDVLVRKGH